MKTQNGEGLNALPCSVFSPAKINLFLQILGKRPDSFHEIVTFMTVVNIGDQLIFSKSTQTLELSVKGFPLPENRDNLVWKAVELFYAYAGLTSPGWHVCLNKHILPGSGLGSGSSNAVCTLKFLNQFHDNCLTLKQLTEIASKLGSDTVFFIEGGSSVCTGRGEIIDRKIQLPSYYALIFTPNFKGDTKTVYSNYKADHQNAHDLETLLSALSSSLDEALPYIRNDLANTFYEIYPQGRQVKDELRRIWERPVFLSGSGSSFFTLFEDQSKALYYQQKTKEHAQLKGTSLLGCTIL